MTGFRKPSVRRWSPLVLTSTLALSTAFLDGRAWAQTTSFNAGNPTVASGSVTFDRGVTTPGTEVYTINSRTAVLNFTPNDTALLGSGSPINFQNGGTTVRYTNGDNTPTFTVLNRIVPTDTSRPVQFNGRVISEIRAGQTVTPGGDVWFYSPGGVILGTTAAFDVGSLLLTARDPTGGTGVIASTTSFRGGGIGGANGARIEIQQGATINATREGSYVALMAPQIRQTGTVRVNGSAAYVAADDATVTINPNGLFDIAVTIGTDSGNGFPIIHGGSTGGPASTGAADPHRVYMVAVPKNTAITLLLGDTSRVGFDVATTAGVENGRVVLSSGRMSFNDQLIIQNGALSTATGLTMGNQPFTATPADVHIYGDLSSSLFARAWTNAYLATAGGSTTVTGDVFLRAGARAHIASVGTGRTTSISGNVTLSTDVGTMTARQSGGQTVFDQTAGDSYIFAQGGGTVNIGGSVFMTANAFLPPPGTGVGPLRSLVTGGRSTLFAGGGTIRIGGSTTLQANASLGTFVDPAFVPQGDLRGGTAGMSASQGGSIILNGASNTISANAIASNRISIGDLLGGTTFFNANAQSTLQAAGSVSLAATASDEGVVGGGNAQGGRADVFSTGTVSIGGGLSLSVDASAGGDDRADGGDALGGTAIVNGSTNGLVSVGGLTQISAIGRGGAISGGDGIGGNAAGGTAQVFAGGTVNLGAVNGSASAFGGGNTSAVAGGSGGDAVAGRATISAGQGTATIAGNVSLFAVGTGGSTTGIGGNGGDGTGGLARLEVNGASGRVTITGNASVDASGAGGAGLGGTSAGGDGRGGFSNQANNFPFGAYIFAGSGILNISGTATVTANGLGGAGGDAGDGFGGFGSVTAYDGALTIAGATAGSASGIGGNSNASDPGDEGGFGGNGEGGEFFINAQVVNTSVGGLGSVRLGNVAVAARGQGGTGSAGIGGDGGYGGNGFGGFIQSYASASSQGVTMGDVLFDASGIGGLAGAGGAGAQGQAGFAGGFGGDGLGGTTNIGTQSGIDRPANTGFHTFGSAVLVSDGIAGAGGAGGAGGSGAAGGRGGEGGLGQGGGATLLVRGTTVTGQSLTMSARGVGGTGGAGGTGSTAGATGVAGDGDGGANNIVVSNRFQRTERGRVTVGAITANTSGIGGSATSGLGEINVSGADATFASYDYTSAGATFVSADPTVSRPAFLVSVADGTVTITGSLRLTVAGVFNLTGPLAAQTISIASRGIFLGSNALLGGANTQSISLSNFVPGGSILLGGEDADDNTYSLSNAEVARLRANQIEVRGASGQAGQSPVTVRNLTVAGSAGSGTTTLVGSNAEFRISGDVVRVEGAVRLTGAGANDTLSLIGARRVEVVTDRGGLLSVTGPMTGDVLPLAGTLSLNAPVIGVGTNDLLTQLAANPRFEGRNALLSAAPTTPTPAGYVQANRLILTTSNVAAIQNSGTATVFGGFTAGLGGLVVRAPDGTQAGSTAAQVVVYGRVQRPGGGFFEGNDIGSAAAFGAGQADLFDRTSTVNGCAVGATCGSEPAAIVAAVTAIEEVLSEVEDEAELVEVPTIDVVQVVDPGNLVLQPPVTEPVSGAGNTGLWDDDEDRPADAASVAGGQTR